jgi:hypothetical protein
MVAPLLSVTTLVAGFVFVIVVSVPAKRPFLH